MSTESPERWPDMVWADIRLRTADSIVEHLSSGALLSQVGRPLPPALPLIQAASLAKAEQTIFSMNMDAWPRTEIDRFVSAALRQGRRRLVPPRRYRSFRLWREPKDDPISLLERRIDEALEMTEDRWPIEKRWMLDIRDHLSGIALATALAVEEGRDVKYDMLLLAAYVMLEGWLPVDIVTSHKQRRLLVY